MTTMTTPPLRERWSTDDLADLPDDGRRYELVDGALLVSPPPTLGHDDLASQLLLRLGAGLPPDLRVAAAPGLFFDRHNYRQPDVVVYRRAATASDELRPADVVLAVEVMSPSSVSNDRVTKPAQYAAAGIPHYWRVERDPLTLFVLELDGDVYRERAQLDDLVELDAPVPVRFRLGGLLP